jgi:hypothetical protein
MKPQFVVFVAIVFVLAVGLGVWLSGYGNCCDLTQHVGD